MISSNDSLTQVNITAGTVINQEDLYTEDNDISENQWYADDKLHISGNLTWDNGSAILGEFR